MPAAKKKPVKKTTRESITVADVHRSAVHARIASAWYRHPVALISGGLALLGAVATASPLLLGALRYYQTADDAADMERRLEAKFGKFQQSQQTSDAFRDMRSIRMEAIVAKNRVNDCNVLRDNLQRAGKYMSPTERAACDQYQGELDDANRRYAEAQRAAMALTKEAAK